MRDKRVFTVVALVALSVSLIGIGAFEDFENPGQENKNIKKFESEKEFRQFVARSDSSGSFGRLDAQVQELQATADTAASGSSGSSGSYAVERSSDTNIQVEGVGEPDILKNNGRKMYYSPEDGSHYLKRNWNSSVFNTLPAENFSELEEIPDYGKMFLTKDKIIFLGENITAYSKEDYSQEWSLELNYTIEAARKVGGELYLVQKDRLYSDDPCPVRPLESKLIECTDFYYSSSSNGGDTAYTLSKIDPDSGEVLKTEGFVGSSRNSVVYVSQDSIYLTHSRQKSETDLMTEFLEERGSELIDSATIERIQELQEFNLSESSLQIELRNAIDNYRKTLEKEEQKEFEKRFENQFGNYTAERKRELSSTSIAKFNSDLELESEGEVPGVVNDQFSLSESGETFRIATTVANSWRWDVKSENDLYTLDEDLNRQGSIQGMGLNEQIYSVRYIGDKAYVVTFRRIDPFHVIDLSDPENPEMEGKLKLPGFSSYLHPLQENRILGIGEEDGKVKAVIFDVSGEPEVADSKILDEWHSEISESHHAFTIDRQNKVFFLPGTDKAHIFSYKDDIEHVKKVELDNPKRAAFVNQNFYVFGDQEASVINQTSWDTVKTVKFRNKTERDYYPVEPMPRPGRPGIVR